MRRFILIVLSFGIATLAVPSIGSAVTIPLGDVTVDGTPILLADRDYPGFTIRNLDYDPFPARVETGQVTVIVDLGGLLQPTPFQFTRLFLTGTEITADENITVTLAFDLSCSGGGANCPDRTAPPGAGSFRSFVASVAGFFSLKSEETGQSEPGETGQSATFRAKVGPNLISVSPDIGPFSPSEFAPEFSGETNFTIQGGSSDTVIPGTAIGTDPSTTLGPNIHGEVDLKLFAGDSITLAFEITQGPLGFSNLNPVPPPTSDPNILSEIFRPIPEPASVILFASGLTAMLLIGKRNQKR